MLFQIVLDFTLIFGVLIFPLMLHKKANVSAIEAIFFDSGRGVIIGFMVILVNIFLGLYDGFGKLAIGQIRARAVLSFLFSIAIIYGVFSGIPLNSSMQNNISIMALVVVMGCMLAVRVLALNILPIKYMRRRILIFGVGKRAHIVGKALKNNDPSIELVGYFAGLQEHDSDISEGKIIPKGETLTEIVKKNQVDEIVVALSERRGGSMPMRELLDCKLKGIKVIDISTHFEQYSGQIRLDTLYAGWLIFSGGFNQGFMRSGIKWLFDMIAAVILLVMALPVMAMTAALISIESSGPIFYRQARVGRNGRVFNVIKFRSMYSDAEKDGTPRWASAGDSRITRVGKFIRKMRIDELPQLFCVLKGDMSLVGPRPERPYFVERLTLEIPYYAVRHSIKPGLTGWAQVRYHYGASVEDTEHKLQYDLYYVKNHSWFLDLVILFETVGVVLTGKGAQ
ncbi:TIGR03013 family XrtA/PEP-CTERM system glycosyltransferase [Simplicispira psychrophila]|uniref:TIGR03013 family XrtA/PEP-CTERM system glycosyltransferase n=1 Tax=Simplicispira psychrophila TaxID=80882 RepID=UPI001FDF10A4|nr:TIGR03013 family XrtA/PEP-CTERM system glycosyltransferase [Simplicispira psychrophila]